MRKVFWWGAAALVVTAGAFGLVADHVCRNPASWVSRFATAGVVRHFVFHRSTAPAAGLADVCPTASVAGAHASCPPMAATPMVDECPKLVLAPPAAEAREPIVVEVPHHLAAAQEPAAGAFCPEGVAGIEPDPGCKGNATEECESAPAFMPAVAVEESEETVLMPRCGEDEAEKSEVMPYAEETPKPKDEDCCPFRMWFRKFQKDADKDGDTHEQTELVPMGPCDVPVFREGYPPLHRAGTPDCQVDPHYPHHYPGCPHMGGCPYGGCPPKYHDVPMKQGKKELKANPTSFQKVKPGKSDLPMEDECIRRTGVDTMECRPSDVKKAGFDPYDPF